MKMLSIALPYGLYAHQFIKFQRSSLKRAKRGVCGFLKLYFYKVLAVGSLDDEIH